MRRIKPSTFIAIILSFIALLFEFFLGGAQWVSFIILIILISLPLILIKKIFSRKQDFSLKNEWFKIIRNILVISGFFISILISVLAYSYFFPTPASDVVITNSEKTITFLSMSHIATPEFYRDKKVKIASLARSGSIFLVEWVWKWSAESHRKLSQALSFELDEDLYPFLALYGSLEVQSGSFLFQDVLPLQIKNVDMTVDEIVGEMSTGDILPSEVIYSTEDLPPISSLSPWERVFMKYFFRAFLSSTLSKMEEISMAIIDSKKELFSIILDKRNQRVIEAINQSTEKNIVVVYWALHFSGILRWLEQTDPRYKIESFSLAFPYSELKN